MFFLDGNILALHVQKVFSMVYGILHLEALSPSLYLATTPFLATPTFEGLLCEENYNLWSTGSCYTLK